MKKEIKFVLCAFLVALLAACEPLEHGLVTYICEQGDYAIEVKVPENVGIDVVELFKLDVEDCHKDK
ncbi:MAG: hypothetical protein KZQ66_03595 [Candidatus Thiodiazotropha sp. (ex Lucinoma aequizonata)]|nr:hypothetical protein [Candidatus Thiodiazotropha sp. (ex Lucinoma aequizonata)]MCU7889909.1 hypothetical protein [Candidatus Thiodiazotropha sp. (ex Lucinoma aequizonata)]MCU7894412.1 hypothetical protein [Candidatus Thiodiazotropha sp. (ex Lucinoma aequizonata)]MCU7899816.1 hypothetical protein [Candidatus Thiodiazotropha sp. (ex Lucinoma aequizonata)]MCU7901200.1 hypothetical protein [Candidatus Thiodiazotropha sp. (ex Lucinoma aequizonata)]